MSKSVNLNFNSLPAAVGPYSQAVKINNLIFLSGQIPIDVKTGLLIENNIEKQTHQVLNNIRNFLKDNNLDMNAIIKTNVYVKDITDFPKINEIYASYFRAPYPARALVEVSRLPKDVLIEIECVIAAD